MPLHARTLTVAAPCGPDTTSTPPTRNDPFLRRRRQTSCSYPALPGQRSATLFQNQQRQALFAVAPMTDRASSPTSVPSLRRKAIDALHHRMPSTWRHHSAWRSARQRTAGAHRCKRRRRFFPIAPPDFLQNRVKRGTARKASSQKTKLASMGVIISVDAGCATAHKELLAVRFPSRQCTQKTSCSIHGYYDGGQTPTTMLKGNDKRRQRNQR